MPVAQLPKLARAESNSQIFIAGLSEMAMLSPATGRYPRRGGLGKVAGLVQEFVAQPTLSLAPAGGGTRMCRRDPVNEEPQTAGHFPEMKLETA